MASKKKPAIQARQGHPTGLLDDIGEAIFKQVEKQRLNRRVRQVVPRKSVKGKDDLAMYRSEARREIKRAGGPSAVKSPRSQERAARKRMRNYK